MENQTENYLDLIQKQIDNNKIVLYMKGTAALPQCGFSSTVVQILNLLQVEFLDINVLEDQDLRNKIKEFSDWPTIPQLYCDGEFVGGCDILREMYQDGSLQKLLNPDLKQQQPKS